MIPGDQIPGDEIPGDMIPGDMIPGDMIPGGKMCPCRWATSTLPCSRTRSAVQEAQPSGHILACSFYVTYCKRQYIKGGNISACSPHPIYESLGKNHLFQGGSEVGAGWSESSIDGRSAGRNS